MSLASLRPNPLQLIWMTSFRSPVDFFVNLPGNLHITVTPHLSYGTPESVLLCIQLMQQFSAIETAEVVSLAIY